MIECAVAAGALLGESPVWSGAEACLYWVDIDGRRVHRYDPSTGQNRTTAVPGRPGSIAVTAEPGMLLVASEHEVGRLDFASGAWAPWVELEEAGTGNRLNDGRCDPAGRFWVGSMFEDTTAERFTGMLHRVDADGAVTTAVRELGVSNGLAFAPDGGTMYHADSPRATVWASPYDPATGTAGPRRVLSDFAGLPGKPDGACVDETGCYWVACVYGWAVARLTPDGVLDRLLELPIEKPTMPAFGGPGLATMFVTSIGGARPAGNGEHEPGGLYALDVGVAGIPEPVFAG
jgi:sugar lactone lactonase YvrE